MTKENLKRLVKELAEEYTDAAQLNEGGKTLVKIPSVSFPTGCTPPGTTALVVLDEGQPAPQLFLKALPTLPNGKAPRSVNTATFAGDTWHGFSFNQAWDEHSHTAVQFVEGRLRRFALSE
jgi:hypothetical protein